MIKVLVMDASPASSRFLVNVLNSDPGIEVIGNISESSGAENRISELNPDVLMLNVEFLKNDGGAFLKNLMRVSPLPVVVISPSGTEADITLRALEFGAIDYVSRPKEFEYDDKKTYMREIISKIKIASAAQIRKVTKIAPVKNEHSGVVINRRMDSQNMVIAIGASTGGTEALKDVVCHLPSSCPAVVITQHIPATFSKPFAERLNVHSGMKIMQAVDGQPILPGHGYVAPGDRHLEIVRKGDSLTCRLLDTEPVNRHKPSVEVMFHSVAKNMGKNAIGILLTGMGDDGANALGTMKQAGAVTIAQDEASSVVWGMPGEAVKRGFASEVQPLHKISERILYYAHKNG